ncbi:hypothetical protein [Rhodoferax sp.]|uniref:hypothetical protein n=1 Tax=Rhodoferax sp. TaxID=50421 RepID=UPI0026013D92|nr:hypothetical protein [Rhodoferax sp.]MCM2341668.1 hypothetical protein [Rhodoferax sp.]
MKKIIGMIAVVPGIATAGLFGPSNFEECILDGMKNVKSDQAARMITVACRQKFPQKSAPPIQVPETPERHEFRSTGMSRPSLNSLIAKIEIVRWTVVQTGDYSYGIKSFDYGHHVEIDVTNRNTFPIVGLEIGLLKSKARCSWVEESVYAEFYSCTGTANPSSSATFRCDIPRLESRKISWCPIGFAVYGTEGGITEWMKENEIPNRKN